ncbi:MAG TPA: peptidoglycan DD-metalloendopeptidase family protein [Hyphomonadaceae bacterium]|nr:peptidoglycan DD-metalloendopeptidase family protein [Hyphomonadaceae bacterium]
MKNAWFEWGLGVAAAALMGTGLVVVGVIARPVEAATSTTADAKTDPRLMLASLTSADQDLASKQEMRRVSVARNETLSGVLDRIGAPRDEANAAVYAAAQATDLRNIRPGDDITAWLETDDTTGAVRLMGVSLRPEVERQVLVSKNLDGAWTTHELKTSMTPGINYIAGDIDSTIYESALALGAGDQQVVDYATIFGYDIDFQREIRPGDHFEFLYETFDDERGRPVKAGNMLMASIEGAALTKTFYRYTPSDDGAVDYFDEQGQSAKKFLMKTPINGARISSSFGNRVHPILGYTKLHKGTDFAAMTGTPIYAAGNGVIGRYGPFSTYGNYALIKHANGYETAYGHMSRYVKGLRVGSHVTQGQVIGYVGMTGGATGPHLHYEVHINGKALNAMTLKLPTGRKLGGDQLEAFKTEMARINALRDAELANQALVAAAEPAPKTGFATIPAAATSAPDTRDEISRP